MSRIAALSILTLCVLLGSFRANAAEGLTFAPTPAPAKDRTSNYAGARVQAPADGAGKLSGKVQAQERRMHGKSNSAAKTARGAAVAMSARSSDFYIYRATSTLRSDRDGDGYHAEFKVRVDADVRFGDAYVYARLYLRRAGERDWLLYHETDDFFIRGQSPDDEYYIVTTLDDGYPTAEYDVLIDLYESGYQGVVATIGPLDSPALSYLPLEEAGLDAPVGIAGYRIRNVSTQLLRDADRDGYYSQFRITFDPDADDESRLVYARIWVRARGGDWIEEYATQDFWVDVSGEADAYELNVEWRSGYPSAYYDVQIDLHDAVSDLLVASAGSDRPALAQLPLEDQSRDQSAAPPPPAPLPDGGVSSREGGGGAFGPWALIGLATLVFTRRARRGASTLQQG